MLPIPTIYGESIVIMAQSILNYQWKCPFGTQKMCARMYDVGYSPCVDPTVLLKLSDFVKLSTKHVGLL